ncbi:MAG: NYN domain-containing protein [Clostridia bacterium]|nr:NYN domain-containing protein [Clostridia bacterium]
MKRISLGILAHVDAGKTTLSEAMLYSSGALTRLGRVDKKDTFLDTHDIERDRGITVFSKLASFEYGGSLITLVDTPGHVDFFTEAERSLSIQDYAILLVSAPDGPTPHTVTLFNLLASRRIPTFIFVNKTDISERRRIDLLGELRRAFGSGVVDFGLEGEDPARFFEECAGADERLMESYFERGEVDVSDIAVSIKGRRIFPAIFGSALKCRSVDTLLSAIARYTIAPRYSPDIFGARVYKIATAPDGARLTYLKVTGGRLAPKTVITYKGKDGSEYSEKIETLRLYSGDKFKAVSSAEAGTVCAAVGLTKTYAGMGLGVEPTDSITAAPPLDYKLTFEGESDIYRAYLKLASIAEEDPSLNIRYDHDLGEIKVSLMGEIQAEVLTELIRTRLGLRAVLSDGAILYKETIAEEGYGAGHFEPLMHYAEVRLKLTPLPLGSGLVFARECSEDALKLNWQRLIIQHLGEKAHRGKLIGAPITDMRISVIGGRAHPKHTEGGDFREATYRALRQGLMKAEMRLLEPTFNFTIQIPTEYLGRVLTDISTMKGECEEQSFTEDGRAELRGYAPVYTMRYYANRLRAFTAGAGRIMLSVGDYQPCHNEDEVRAAYAYDPELDSAATADSIFCKGGVGYSVPWSEADALMHTEAPTVKRAPEDEDGKIAVPERAKAQVYRGTAEEDKELMKIFEATYGKVKPRAVSERTVNAAAAADTPRRKPKPKGEDYLIIDGYNLIFAWDELKALAEEDLSHARDALIHLMCNYRGYKKVNLILVFDAYKRRDNEGSVTEIGGITVVYTKERQTADAYIEKSTYSLADKNSVRVVTSDYVEQLVVLGSGGVRVSAREFIAEVKAAECEIRGIIGG